MAKTELNVGPIVTYRRMRHKGNFLPDTSRAAADRLAMTYMGLSHHGERSWVIYDRTIPEIRR